MWYPHPALSILLSFQVLLQLSSCFVVPDQVGVLRVGIQQLQDLNAKQTVSLGIRVYRCLSEFAFTCTAYLNRGRRSELPCDVRSQHGCQALANGRVFWECLLHTVSIRCGIIPTWRGQRLGVTSQTAESYQTELGQMVCNLLLICFLACLHAAFFQGVIVVEEVSEQWPQHASMIQMGLQEEIHREGAHTLDCHGGCFWETLRERRGYEIIETESTKTLIFILYWWKTQFQINITMILTFP